MQQKTDTIKNHITNIQNHLEYALDVAKRMQDEVQAGEGDSELFRKISYYLVPNLNHWINGTQSGSIKDLEALLKNKDTTNPNKKENQR
jgi:hypothetical protein